MAKLVNRHFVDHIEDLNEMRIHSEINPPFKAGAKMLSFAWTAPVISTHDDLIKYRYVMYSYNY